MAEVYLALGSNVGDRCGYMRRAFDLLRAEVHGLRASRVYETTPMGYEKQGNFLNAALGGDTELSPEGLLAFVKRVEREVGRIRRFPLGPREIDIDILFYSCIVYRDGTLEIPHPRLCERDFVLRPLVDLDGGLLHPVCGKTVGQLYDELPMEGRHVIAPSKDCRIGSLGGRQ
jgi:2-amino-4-hydroxy-6-hydroxymethyldihydropteridine diphosphokinase